MLKKLQGEDRIVKLFAFEEVEKVKFLSLKGLCYVNKLDLTFLTWMIGSLDFPMWMWWWNWLGCINGWYGYVWALWYCTRSVYIFYRKPFQECIKLIFSTVGIHTTPRNISEPIVVEFFGRQKSSEKERRICELSSGVVFSIHLSLHWWLIETYSIEDRLSKCVKRRPINIF
jgi:hypothetical protein